MHKPNSDKCIIRKKFYKFIVNYKSNGFCANPAIRLYQTLAEIFLNTCIEIYEIEFLVGMDQ